MITAQNISCTLKTTISNISKTVSNSFGNHFFKIVIATIAFSAIAFILKTKNIFSGKKSSPISGDKPGIRDMVYKEVEFDIEDTSAKIDLKIKRKDACRREITGVCQSFNCQPKDLFKVSKEDYDDLMKHIEENYKYKEDIEEAFKLYSRKGSAGNVFFAGEKGLEAYSHAIIASRYAEGKKHKISGLLMKNIIHVPTYHRHFEAVKNMNGGPAPRIKDAYAIRKRDFIKFIETEARKIYKENANYICLTDNGLKEFRKEIVTNGGNPEEFKFEIIGQFGSRLYLALPEGSKEKYDWTDIKSANKKDIDIESICSKMDCEPEEIIAITKEDFRKFTEHIESRSSKGSIDILDMVKKNAIVGSSDNVFFAGEKGISIYCRALVVSKYIEHPLNDMHIEDIACIDSEDILFDSLKDSGAAIPSLKGKYVVSRLNYTDIVKHKAIDLYKENAIFGAFKRDSFNTKFLEVLEEKGFKESEVDYAIIGELDRTTYVAFPEGSKEKYNWIILHKAKKAEKQ